MDVLRILDDLTRLIEEPKTIGPVTYGLDKEEIVMQITKIRASLPNEVKAAAQTVRDADQILHRAQEEATKTTTNAQREAERITAEAQKEADRVLDQARAQQAKLIEESEILKLSRAQAEQVRNSAELDALQMKRGAEKYAYDVLSQMETIVGKVLNTVERGKQDLKHTPEPLAPTQAVVREKVRA